MTCRAVAQCFGDCLVRDDYGAACALLGADLRSPAMPAVIRDAVATMLACARGSIRKVQVMDDFMLEN